MFLFNPDLQAGQLTMEEIPWLLKRYLGFHFWKIFKLSFHRIKVWHGLVNTPFESGLSQSFARWNSKICLEIKMGKSCMPSLYFRFLYSFFLFQEAGIWNRLSQSKGLFIEPRRKQGLSDAMEEFYQKVHDPSLKGAIFFAVCRGKVCTLSISWIFFTNLNIS